MFSFGRFQLRSWMFIYVGLIAAIVLARAPTQGIANDTDLVRTPAAVAETPLLRHDI